MGCDKELFDFKNEKELLQNHQWRLNSIIDEYKNEKLYHPDYMYDFKSEGKLDIYSSDEKMDEVSWELVDEKYLHIGLDKYQLNYISDKLLSLQYGNFCFYYYPD